MEVIPYGRQDIIEADIEAVINVLRSDFITQGPTVPAFEKAISEYCGTQHAVAVNSATSALHIACLALGAGPEDLVWTSPITFVASANCALYCGASVDFVDIDPCTCNMSVTALEEKLIGAQRHGKLPSIVIPVHFSGQPCDMERIHSLGQRYGFKIIEDASHAIGGKYKGEPIGSCHYSDITVFSFHPVKVITSGEGGMALTNNQKLATHMGRLRNHGITRDLVEMQKAPEGPWVYQQVDLGFNYRMTDIHAALGLSQMQRLDEFIIKRHLLSKRYDDHLAQLPVIVPWQHPDSYSGMHLYVIRLKLHKIGKSHLEVFEGLRSAGIGVNLHYIPVYRQPYYERMGFRAGHCPEAELYYKTAISLPIFPTLSYEQQDKIIGALKLVLNDVSGSD